jgi:hypothetical protein
MQTTAKKSSKFTKKIIYVDDMMIHNLVKYLVQTRLRLLDIKITNFKPESCPDNLLEICYFYISQTKSSLDKIFYKVVYHHIIYICDFFGEFRRLFCHGLHGFSRRVRFPPDMLPLVIHVNMGQKLGRYALWESITNGTVQSKHGWFSF